MLTHSHVLLKQNKPTRSLHNLVYINIPTYIYERLEDLIISHNEFIKMINKYESSIGKEAFISMYENI